MNVPNILQKTSELPSTPASASPNVRHLPAHRRVLYQMSGILQHTKYYTKHTGECFTKRPTPPSTPASALPNVRHPPAHQQVIYQTLSIIPTLWQMLYKMKSKFFFILTQMSCLSFDILFTSKLYIVESSGYTLASALTYFMLPFFVFIRY